MKISFKRLAAILSVAAIVGLALIVMRPEPPRQEGAPAIGGPSPCEPLKPNGH